jgi:hypothetical protein
MTRATVKKLEENEEKKKGTLKRSSIKKRKERKHTKWIKPKKWRSYCHIHTMNDKIKLRIHHKNKMFLIGSRLGLSKT